MDPFGQLPSHLPSPLLAPGLNGPSVQSAVEVVLRPGQGATESFGSKAAIWSLVKAGHLGLHAVHLVAPDKEQDVITMDRLKHNHALLVLVQLGHHGHHALLHVDLDLRLGAAVMERLK